MPAQPHSPTLSAYRRRAPFLLLACVGVLALAGCRKTTIWSPDSKQIAIEADGGLRGYDVATGTFRTLVKGLSGEQEALAPSWSPDSRQFAFFEVQVEKDKLKVELVVVEVTSGKREVVVAEVPVAGPEPDTDDAFSAVRTYCAAFWSPDGKEIAFVAAESGNSALWVVPAGGGALRKLTPNGRQAAAPASIPPRALDVGEVVLDT